MAKNGKTHRDLTTQPSRTYTLNMSKLLRTSEVADLLLVSNRTIQRWADKNIIKAKVLPSGHRRFDEKEINKLTRGQ